MKPHEPMTPEEFAERMKLINDNPSFDEERTHFLADALMCDVLRLLGYGEGVATFYQLDKWYA